MAFTHFHVHSQYSILDGAASVPGLVEKAIADGMKAISLTDHGNMFGIKLFYDTCRKKGIKPILGVEAYVARVSLYNKEKPVDRSGEHLIILAKNLKGYLNLIKLCSAAFVDGYYYRPRIDKALLEKHHEGLIISSACLGGEICQKIMAGDIEGAEAAALWYKNLVGEDYYLEVMRHPAESAKERAEVYDNQVRCNAEILRMGEKLGIKVIATNDVHFLNAEDAEAHDLLICLNTRKDLDDPNRMRYTRQEWFKTTAEMEELFKDIPQVIENTQEIVDKVEDYKLDSDPLMPVFPIPPEIGTEEEYRKKYTEEDLFNEFTRNEKGEVVMSEEDAQKKVKKLGGYDRLYRIKLEADYLKELAMKGAVRRYGENIPPDIMERLIFELHIMKTMGFPGYFLIVQDFIQAARDMGVIVGPGRGSAAGSAVAYSLGITNIDPVKYDLLFERFLNPDRISLPDIDVDFDDDGRQRVLEWVTQKYGADKVSHIVTFGSMAAKMAIKDVARVLKLDLSEANRLAKMVPETPKITLKKAYKENPDLEKERESSNPLVAKTLHLAEILEGSVRQTGVHACGILISRDPLTEHIPIMPTEGESLMTTQYDGHFVEPIGLIKMDFLGLRTLSIIKTCLDNIKKSRHETLDVDAISLEDKETFELFSRGETTGLFQFESPGMKKHLRALKPNRFEDLVAMNALYRPGPMEYIPDFIKRKHGEAPIEYDHPMMEPYLKDTYGITVYQEQVMLQSRALGNFTRGMSDTLRKAMGKKQIDTMNQLKTQFIEGCNKNEEFVKGCKEMGKEVNPLVDKIWGDWEAFASYAFNKSHSAAYALISYHTAYLKTHHKVEFMAALLTSEIGNQDKILKYIAACKDNDIEVRQPDVQVSRREFIVRDEAVVYGLGGIKNVGDEAIREIVAAREKDGPFLSFLDLCIRVSLRKVTKRVLESLIKGGALDCFGCSRAAMVAAIDPVVARAQKKIKEKQSNQISLLTLSPKKIEENQSSGIGFSCEEESISEWDEDQKLRFEKEALGFFLTSHPLQPYRHELNRLDLRPLEDCREMADKATIKCAVLVTSIREILNKRGNRMAFVAVEDLTASGEVTFFTEELNASRDLLNSEQPLLLTATIDNRESSSYSPDSDDDSDDEAPVKEIKLRGVSVQALNDACSASDAPISWELDPRRLNAEGMESLKAILERHKGNTEMQLAFCLDGTFCRVRLGPQWMVTPGPAFQQDMHRWCSANPIQ